MMANKGASHPLVVVPLEVAVVTDVQLVGTFGFSLCVADRRHDVSCASEQELEQWINAITQAKVTARILAGTLQEAVQDTVSGDFQASYEKAKLLFTCGRREQECSSRRQRMNFDRE